MRTPSILEPPKAIIPARVPLAELEVALITRLYGGGATTRALDPISWLRSSALKSALRFWWRTGHAKGSVSLADLRAKEERLFGAPARFVREKGETRIVGGPGMLEVEVFDVLRPEPSAYDLTAGNPLTVAYFAARAQEGGAEAADLGMPNDRAHSARARLRLLFKGKAESPEGQEIIEALRLWLVLGGAGARTRRGAGAVAVTSVSVARTLGLPTSHEELNELLARWCRPLNVPPALAGVFTLARTRSVFVGTAHRDAESAQRELLSVYRAVRQRGREPGQDKWPEANQIRLSIRSGSAPRGRFPRGALGLPIVFFFGRGNPLNRTLIGARRSSDSWNTVNRFASPILLRPVRIWIGDQPRYVPVAIVTACTLPIDMRPALVQNPGEALDPERNLGLEATLAAAAEEALVYLEGELAKRFTRLEL